MNYALECFSHERDHAVCIRCNASHITTHASYLVVKVRFSDGICEVGVSALLSLNCCTASLHDRVMVGMASVLRSVNNNNRHFAQGVKSPIMPRLPVWLQHGAHISHNKTKSKERNS